MLPIPTSFGALRPWSLDDAAALVKYADNRKIWLNLRDLFPHPYTLGDARAFLGWAVGAPPPSPPAPGGGARGGLALSGANPPTVMAIATAEEAIGGIGLSPNQDVHRLTAEMGYWLAEPFWGRGIMSEAVARFADYGFEQFGLVRIYAEPYAHNAASCRVLEKAGFTLEGRLRSSVIKDGQIIDQFLYAKVRRLPSPPRPAGESGGDVEAK